MDKKEREKQKTETKRVSIWKVILNFLELEISYQKVKRQFLNTPASIWIIFTAANSPVAFIRAWNKE